MQFRVLGSLDVTDGDRRVDLGAPRERALFTLLLLNANQIVSRDRIVEELWPDGAPRTVAKVVHVYVAHLRKALGGEPGRLLVRIDPATGETKRIDLGGTPQGIAIGGGLVWVGVAHRDR